MTSVTSERNARVASVVAATGIALACGTNYAYSAWGPDFAHRMGLTATESNVIGAAGNVGAYAMGVPAGLLIDSRGTRAGVLVGAISLACGYFPIHTAFDQGPGSMSVGFISFCSFLTGAGSCTAFSAAIKTSAYNWPTHRGTATAFPLSAFGLSAFFFTTIGKIFLGDSTSDFLLLLAAGTMVLNVTSFFFLRLIPTSQASAPIAVPEEAVSSASTVSGNESNKIRLRTSSDRTITDDERANLVARTSTSSELERDEYAKIDALANPDVTGVKLLVRFEFWQLFAMLALLAGVGLMTINNIGNDAASLWRKYDPNATPEFIHGREQLHVGILSLCSFAGRFVSGIGSDILIKRLGASRFWCLVLSAGIFTVAQSLALITTNPNLLFLVSSLTGLGYGALFGCFPALTADAFGVSGLSLNWGFMIFAPVISGNIFNLMYGHIFDGNTPHKKGGQGECMKGLGCYASAYWLTLASSIAGIVGALWCVGYERRKRRKMGLAREA